jgi:hypothetical protein
MPVRRRRRGARGRAAQRGRARVRGRARRAGVPGRHARPAARRAWQPGRLSRAYGPGRQAVRPEDDMRGRQEQNGLFVKKKDVDIVTTMALLIL